MPLRVVPAASAPAFAVTNSDGQVLIQEGDINGIAG
jgi:hypothetical protein